MKSTALTTTTTITSSQEEGEGGPSYEAVSGEEEEDEAAYTGSNEVLEDLGKRSMEKKHYLGQFVPSYSTLQEYNSLKFLMYFY